MKSLVDGFIKFILILMAACINSVLIVPLLAISPATETLLLALSEEIGRTLPTRVNTEITKRVSLDAYLVAGALIGCFEGMAAGSVELAISNTIFHSMYGIVIESSKSVWPGMKGVICGILAATTMHTAFNMTLGSSNVYAIKLVSYVAITITFWVLSRKTGRHLAARENLI